MKKPTIAIDIDDVLADYAAGFIRFSNSHWGTSLTVDDYDEHWANVWKVDMEEVRLRADLIHTHRLVKDLTHRSEARPVLDKLSEQFNLVVVTARRIQNKADTLAWLQLYYPMLSEEVVTFAGFYDSINDQSIHKTKGSIIASLGADYMIDDQPKHCISAVEHNVQAILFGDYTWNRTAELPAGIIRIKDWSGIEEYFDGIR